MQLPPAEELIFGSHPRARVLVVRHASTHSVLNGAAGSSGDSTGLMLWPGARSLCRAILSMAASAAFAGSLVIELGAGAGVCSAVAGLALRPSAVCATDGDARALELCAATWAANKAAPPFCARVFRWDEGWAAAAEALLRDLGAAGDTAPVLVLASECIYPSTPLPAMRHFFCAARRLLGAHAGSTLLLSYVPREPATSLALLGAADAAGLAWEVWQGQASAEAAALGCQASLGEESGGLVLRMVVAAEGGMGPLEDRVRAVFPDAAAALARRQALQQEAEDMAQSGEWGAPPL